MDDGVGMGWIGGGGSGMGKTWDGVGMGWIGDDVEVGGIGDGDRVTSMCRGVGKRGSVGKSKGQVVGGVGTVAAVVGGVGAVAAAMGGVGAAVVGSRVMVGGHFSSRGR
jgi:hypothetical protein